MTTKRQVRNLAAGAMMGLASLLSGCSNLVSEFNPVFRPTEISSTHKQRRLFDFGKQVEKLYESGAKWTLNPQTHTLFVRGEHYKEAMDEFGIVEGDTYTDLFQGSKIRFRVLDTVEGADGTKTQVEIAKEEGLIAGDRSFDTPFGEIPKATVTRSNLDRVLTAKAREFYHNDGLQVVVNETEYPHSTGPSTYFGQAAVSSYDTPASTISLAVVPNVQFASLAAPAADCKYLVDVKQTSNEETLAAKVPRVDGNGNELDEKAVHRAARQDPRLVDRVIVYGLAGNFTMGMYNEVPLNDKDMFVGLGNKPLNNFDAVVARVDQTVGGILNLTQAYRQGRVDIDFMTNETVYLESCKANNDKGNRMERATKWLNQASDLRDAAKNFAGQ